MSSISFQSSLPSSNTPWYTDWNELLAMLNGHRNFVVETAREKELHYSPDDWSESFDREICIIPTQYLYKYKEICGDKLFKGLSTYRQNSDRGAILFKDMEDGKLAVRIILKDEGQNVKWDFDPKSTYLSYFESCVLKMI